MEMNELENVIRVGSWTKEFDILDMKVQMRTLTGDEVWDIMKGISGWDEIAKLTGIKIKTLARSIISINGKKIEYVASNKEESINESKKIDQNEKVIGRWQSSVIDIFYDEYATMREEQQSFLLQSQTSSRKSGVDKNGKSEKPSA